MFKTLKNKHEFGGGFINIRLGNVAVAAAHVVELPPRCNHKGGGGQKPSMCIKRPR